MILPIYQTLGPDHPTRGPCGYRRVRRLLNSRPVFIVALVGLLVLSFTLVLATRDLIRRSQKQVRLEGYARQLDTVIQDVDRLDVRLDYANKHLLDVRSFLATALKQPQPEIPSHR